MSAGSVSEIAGLADSQPQMSSETRPSAVREARKALDLRLIDVAETAGMSVSHISMIEHGYTPARASREKLSKALGVEPGQLWPEEYS